MAKLDALLNIRSVYGDGYVHPDEAVAFAQAQGIKAVGIRDRNSLSAALTLELACRGSSVRPVYGVELSVAPLVKVAEDDSPVTLSLLAQNENGYANLVTLVNAATSMPEGIPYDFLAKHSEGLLLLTGAPSTEIYQLARQEDYEGIEKWVNHIMPHWRNRIFFELTNDHDAKTAVIMRGVTEYFSEFIPTLWQPIVRYTDAQDYESANIFNSAAKRSADISGDALYSINLEPPIAEHTDKALASIEPFAPSQILNKAIQRDPEALKTLQQQVNTAWRIRLQGKKAEPDDDKKRFWMALPRLASTDTTHLNKMLKEEATHITDEMASQINTMLEVAVQAFHRETITHVSGRLIGSAVCYVLGLAANLPQDRLLPSVTLETDAEQNALDIAISPDASEKIKAYLPASSWQATQYSPMPSAQAWRLLADWLVERAPEMEPPAQAYLNLLSAPQLDNAAIEQTRMKLQANTFGAQALRAFEFIKKRVYVAAPSQMVFSGHMDYSKTPSLKSENSAAALYDDRACESLGFPGFVLKPSRTLEQIQSVMKGLQSDQAGALVYPDLCAHASVVRALAEERFEGGLLFRDTLIRQMAQQGAAKLRESFTPEHLAVIAAGGAGRRAKQWRQWVANLSAPKEQWLRMFPERIQSGFLASAGLLVFKEQAILSLKDGLGIDTKEAARMVERLNTENIESVLPMNQWLSESQRRQWDRRQATTFWYELKKWSKNLGSYAQAMRAATHVWTLFALRESDPVNFFFSSLKTSRFNNILGLAAWIVDAQAFGVTVLPPDINIAQMHPIREDAAIRLGLLNVSGMNEKIAAAILDERTHSGNFMSVADFLYRIRNSITNIEPILALYSAGAFDNLSGAASALGLIRHHYGISLPILRMEESSFTSTPVSPSLFWPPVPAPSMGKWNDIRYSLSQMGAVTQGTSPVVALVEQARVVQTYRGEHMMFLKCLAQDGAFSAVVFPNDFNAVYSPLCQSQVVSFEGSWDWRGRRYIARKADKVDINSISQSRSAQTTGKEGIVF